MTARRAKSSRCASDGEAEATVRRLSPNITTMVRSKTKRSEKRSKSSGKGRKFAHSECSIVEDSAASDSGSEIFYLVLVKIYLEP